MCPLRRDLNLQYSQAGSLTLEMYVRLRPNRRFIVLPAVLLSFGCAQPEPPAASPASPAERQARIRDLVECARREIPRIDDGVTSANIVARAVLGRCRAEERASLEAQTRGMSLDRQRGFLGAYSPEDHFTYFVLSSRSQARR